MPIINKAQAAIDIESTFSNLKKELNFNKFQKQEMTFSKNPSIKYQMITHYYLFQRVLMKEFIY